MDRDSTNAADVPTDVNKAELVSKLEVSTEEKAAVD